VLNRRWRDREPPVVLVVGAGSAGLCTAAALRRRGVPAVVLERGTAVGTSWRRRHEELRLNTDRWLSSLPRVRLSRDAGRFVGRDDYIAHLESFSRALDVRVGVGVQRVERMGSGWVVCADGGEWPTDHVVVATGNECVPFHPEWPGHEGFGTPVRHVADIRRVADLAGRRVLLVGAGNSGVDMAGQLVDAGVHELWLSARTPPTILPLEFAGLPMDLVAMAARPLPERVRDAVAARVSSVAIGDLSAQGLPVPSVGPYRKLRTTGVTVAVDRGFARHLRAGRVQVVPEVRRLDGDRVLLRDGRTLHPDLVLLATGYRPGLEALVGHLGVLDPQGRPLAGPGRPTPGAPGLWFVGYWPHLEGALRTHPGEARRVAAAIRRAGR
jgi:cation diffusion facilitator CzcD-associated flavoprotein CzcO